MVYKTLFDSIQDIRIYDIRPLVCPPRIRLSLSAFYANPKTGETKGTLDRHYILWYISSAVLYKLK